MKQKMKKPHKINKIEDCFYSDKSSTLFISRLYHRPIWNLALLFFSVCPIIAQECDKRFTLHTQENLTSLELLEEVARECKLNLLYKDTLSQEILSHTTPKLYIHDLKAQELLDLIFQTSNLHYTLSNQILKIAFLYTQTYELNYVSTSRIGSSSTDVVLSPNLSNQDLPLQLNHDSLSTTATSGRSGTKILSVDENNFWGEIQKEIDQIAYRPEDRFIDKIPRSITINKSAGLLTITASQPQHQRIQAYLSKLNSKMHAQVLISVHIFLIRHNKNNTSGINWSELGKLSNFVIPANSGGLQITNGGINMEFNVLQQGVSLNQVIEFLQSYGEMRSLSNPRVLTLNNQPAIISVGNVLRYTQNSIYQSSSQGSNIQNSIQTYPSVFAGVLLDVTPSIQGDEIILKINPSITRTKNTSLENESNALKTPPNLSTNQLSSLIKVKDGEQIILGGLISDFENRQEFKIPLLGDIPLLRHLFRYKRNNHLSEEMVIIITPQIIDPSKKTHQDGSLSDSIKSLIRQAKDEAQTQSPQPTPQTNWRNPKR